VENSVASKILDQIGTLADIAIYVLDNDFNIVWSNTEKSCTLKHIQPVEGAYCYRVIRSRNGICHQQCPGIVSQNIKENHPFTECAEDIEAIYNVTVATRRDEAGKKVGYLVVQQEVTCRIEEESKWYQETHRRFFSHLARGFAHEINNPLTVISGILQSYESRGDIPEDLRKDFDIMYKACNRIDEFIKHLQQFSDEESPNGFVKNPGLILKKASSFFKEFFRIKDVRINQMIAKKWPQLAISESVLEKIIFNLLHYMADSLKPGGTIDVYSRDDKDDKYFHLIFSSAELLNVPEYLEYLFIPFDNTGQVEAIHSLALSTVRNLVKTYKGNISVKRLKHDGLEFTIDFPVINKVAGRKS